MALVLKVSVSEFIVSYSLWYNILIQTNYSHADNVIALVPSGDWAVGQLMKEDDDGKILTLFQQDSIDKLLALEYHEMLPFLSFLDKYAQKVVNGDEMRR